MGNYTDHFGSTGGGGGILNVSEFSADGTFDPAAEGLKIGDKIIVEGVGGGAGGTNGNFTDLRGGEGGLYKKEVFTLTDTAAITVTVGAGGAHGSVGVASTASGSGVSFTADGGALGGTGSSTARVTYSKGPHWGATLSYINTDQISQAAAGPGVNGYGAGGGAFYSPYIAAGGAYGSTTSNPGSGGLSGSGGQVGTKGMIKIYY